MEHKDNIETNEGYREDNLTVIHLLHKRQTGTKTERGRERERRTMSSSKWSRFRIGQCDINSVARTNVCSSGCETERSCQRHSVHHQIFLKNNPDPYCIIDPHVSQRFKETWIENERQGVVHRVIQSLHGMFSRALS